MRCLHGAARPGATGCAVIDPTAVGSFIGAGGVVITIGYMVKGAVGKARDDEIKAAVQQRDVAHDVADLTRRVDQLEQIERDRAFGSSWRPGSRDDDR